MLIAARVALALRCPLCGKTDIHEQSLFAFSGTSTIKLNCSCGQHQATILRRRGQVHLQVPCYLCDGVHYLQFSPAQFWSGDLEPVSCPETDLHLGVLGPREAVEEFIGSGDEDLDPTALADYFVNPEVMYEVLAAVHDLDDQGRLRCRCGNTDIEYELQPDRLDLVCTRCDSRRSLAARTDADADRARRVRRLEIRAADRRGRGGR